MKAKYFTVLLLIMLAPSSVLPAALKAQGTVSGQAQKEKAAPAKNMHERASGPSSAEQSLSKAQVRAFVACLEELMPLFKKYLSSLDANRTIPMSGFKQWMQNPEVAVQVPEILGRHNLDQESFAQVHARVLAAYAELKAQTKVTPQDPLESAKEAAKLTPEQKKEMELKLQERIENIQAESPVSDLEAVKPFVGKLDSILGD